MTLNANSPTVAPESGPLAVRLDREFHPGIDHDGTDDGLISADCPHCGEALDFHQPDPDLSDRLLATCDECKSWFLTEEGAPEFVWVNPVAVATAAAPVIAVER